MTIHQSYFSPHNFLVTVNNHITINVLLFNRKLYVHVKFAG